MTIDIDFYLESVEQFRSVGVKRLHAFGGLVREIYDAGFFKIATFETVDIGKLNGEHHLWECKLWGVQPSPDEMESYQRRVVVLTDAIRIFLTAFLSEKITKETTSFAKDISKISSKEIVSRSQWIGRLGELLEAVQDKRYRFFDIDC